MQIRNFAIIAHIDHGKSTLADRLLEKTGVIKNDSGGQILDTMDLERERGITIKLNPARMPYKLDGETYELNLIDTPGHVDFSYEVSRSLAAVEGVLLLVDASQGIQAQTMAHYLVAKKQNLVIIPVINKIDLPTAEPEKTATQVIELLGCEFDDLCFISAKTGEGIDDLLEKIVRMIPEPVREDGDKLKALVFDSFFDSYLGVVAYVKVVSGSLKTMSKLKMAQVGSEFEVVECGYMQIKRIIGGEITAGEIGYVATGLKEVAKCRVGDTIIEKNSSAEALDGYRTPKSMVFASLYAQAGEEAALTKALEKLQLNDASLTFEPVRSKALGYGYAVGFLGLLHLEIVKERLEREYQLNIFVTTPTVAYEHRGEEDFEPWVDLEIVSPNQYLGGIIDLASKNRCELINTDYIEDRVVIYFEAPLSDIIVNFYDQLKSASSGFASMDYQFKDYRLVDLVTVDLMIAGERIDALSHQVIREKAERYGRNMVEKLKDLIPRQNFAIILQATIGGKIIARADVSPFRKDVTAKLYGGDVTRKNKLLDKQKKGKKKMRQLGRIQVPSETFIELLKN